MFSMVARKDLTRNEDTRILERWVSPMNDIEITLVSWENYFSVTTHLVEIPEEGEDIPEGEEFIDSIGIIRTKNEGRARERFAQAVAEAKAARAATASETMLDTSAIGKEWESLNGKAQVIGIAVVAGQSRLVVKYESLELTELVRSEELAARIDNDEKRFLSRTPKPLTETNETATISSRVEDFASSFSPLERGKILSVLGKLVANNGRCLTRSELIEEMVADGAVVTVVSGQRALQRQSGSYIEQSRLTKTGMDYAEYLLMGVDSP